MTAKAKTLTETAKAVLQGTQLDEGSTVPTVGPVSGGVSNPNPVDGGATTSTGNAKTLRPKSKASEGRHGQNGGGSGPGEFDGAEDLGGSTPTSLYKDNLGAKASGGKRDTSVKGSGNNQEPPKHLEEEEESFEISEELEDFINEAIEAGLSEDEIEQAIDENFEFVSEDNGDSALEDFINEAIEEGLDEEDILTALEEEYGQLDELSKGTLGRYIKKAKDSYAEASADLARASSDEPRKKTIKKFLNRNQGIDKAVNRLTREELEGYNLDLSEDVNALLEGENLSEDFRNKATTIFEAAVKTRLAEEIKLMEAAYAESLEENIEKIMEEITEDVDKYLSYVVEQWVEDNEVGIESSLRSELTEDFISGLRTLFAEHYIDIPEEEVHVVEELNTTVEELQERLNTEIERNVELTSALNESNKHEIISSVCEGLTAVQTDKLRSLLENVEFSDGEEFIEKVLTIRENYFPTSVKSDNVLDRVESQDPKMISESSLAGPMAHYVKALGGKLPN